MILELALLGLAAASDAEGHTAGRVEAVNDARAQIGIPPMDNEEVFACLLEERPPPFR